MTLEDPATGLDAVASYRATLVVDFESSDAARSRHWTMSLVAVRSSTPAASSLRVEASGTGAPLGPATEARYEDQVYAAGPDGQCLTGPASGGSIVDVLTPVQLLPSVVGATPAGSEAVAGIATDRFTFDEASLGLAGIAKGTGELWVATDGGFIARETVSLTGSGLPFGEEVPGTMTWTYALADAGGPVSPDLPGGCEVARLDLPMPPDAMNIHHGARILAFDSPSKPAAIVAFYKRAAATGGWTLTSAPYSATDRGLLEARVDGHSITVVATGRPSGSSVIILSD